MPARLPDFLGLGTQKGGTTSLHQGLCSHEQIYLPKCKEVHYFDLNYERTSDWYGNHFQKASTEQLCGEITPYYLYHPKAPRRINKLLPKAKLIILLRDPVERTISHYFHARKRGFEHLCPKKAIDAEKSRLKDGNAYSMQKHSYVSRSKYLEQLIRYEELFPRRQLLIAKSETLFTNPKAMWEEITDFLEIKLMRIPEHAQKANTGNRADTEISKELRLTLKKELKETAKGVRRKYGFGWDWCQDD
jgi:hypothetical protein